MSFPFPANPVDGQVATQTQPDGTVLKATYIQVKNEWVVERVAPKPSTLTLASGTAYTVTAGRDGQVLTFDGALNKWTPKTPVNAAGGKGQTFTKGTQAATDTPNPPDPTKPAEMLQAGALQTTLENLHKELKAWNGSAWVNVLTEEEIKAWISAGSLFRGVIKEADLTTLPAVALANRGFYWSWTGAPGYVVQKGDAKIGTDLENEVLQVGDWIQSDGTAWQHVPGDLLSKQRWDSLGSFQPWSDTSWESGSVVSYQKSFFRASTLVAKGDLAPGATPANPGEVQKWVDITPLPSISTGDLNNVNANTIRGGGVHGAVFQWDENIQEWVSSDVLAVSEVKTGTVKFGDLYGEITGVESIDLDATDSTDQDTFVPSVWAVKEYVKGQPNPFLEELEDCTDLSTATDGQVPSWDDANSKWVPTTVSAALAGLTDVDLTTTPPTNGQHLKWDATATKWIPTTVNADDLGDVTLSAPTGGQILQYKTATSSWENVTPDYLNPTNGYTKTEVDNKISTVVTGLEHYEAALSRVDTPPAAPAANDLYIVGATPTGLWTGQANNLARWDGTAWQFEAPKANEAHLVEDVAETWHWNGTAWVKVATATTTGGPAAAGDLWMVGDLKESLLSEPEFKTLLSVTEQNKWVLADGRDVSGTKYAQVTGRNTIPDLRGAYLRMAGVNATNAAWNGGSLNGFQEDSTARPNTAFTTDAQGNHHHDLGVPVMKWDAGLYHSSSDSIAGGAGKGSYDSSKDRKNTADAGNHTHTIVQGGDAETRPKTYSVNYFIKIN